MMSNYEKVQAIDNEIINDKYTPSLTNVKISKVVKFNLSVAYFIALTFLLMKLLLTWKLYML